jgi:hypothetical protein
MGDNVKVLSKVQVLAERYGWSIARAQGFVDGEMFRRRGVPPSTYARVGIDEYSLGFRAGYYERGTSQAMREAEKKVMPASAAADSREVAMQVGLASGRG